MPDTIAKPKRDKPKSEYGLTYHQQVEREKMLADPNFLAAVRSALANHTNSQDIVDAVLASGYGANGNTKAFNPSYTGRWRGAIAYIDRAEG